MDTKNFSGPLTTSLLGAITFIQKLEAMTNKEFIILEIISNYIEFYFKEFELDTIYLSRFSIFCHFNFHKKFLRNNVTTLDIKNVIELMQQLNLCDKNFNVTQKEMFTLKEYIKNNPRGSKLKIWWKSLWK